MVREAEWLLFDCGEATQMQVVKAGLSPSRLSAIFITHLHGDHLNGLPGLLSTMALDRRERELVVVGPPDLREYLATLTRLKTMFVNYPLNALEFREARELKIVYDAPEYAVRCRELDHRLFALGYRVDEKPRPGKFDVEAARRLGVPEGPLFKTLQSGTDVRLENGTRVRASDVVGAPRPGKAVAYCLDTRPCPAAAELAAGVDLLVHEATYSHEFQIEAREYGHSTAADAAETARAARAKRLLLTHFSSRFADPSLLLTEARAIFPQTSLAEDLTSVEV